MSREQICRRLLAVLLALFLAASSKGNDPAPDSPMGNAAVAPRTAYDLTNLNAMPDTLANSGPQPSMRAPVSYPPQNAPLATTRPFRRFESTVSLDDTGFAQPMAAATLFIPHGWRTTGGVFWAQEFTCTNGYSFGWTATSPDGLTSMALWPQAA